MIAPADGRNDCNAHALPVSADQMLAVVVVDLHGSGIIGKQAEVRRHSCLEFRKKERIASGVMPCALKNVIVHKEVNTVDAAPAVGSGTVEADPVRFFIEVDGRQIRTLILIQRSAFFLFWQALHRRALFNLAGCTVGAFPLCSGRDENRMKNAATTSKIEDIP